MANRMATKSENADIAVLQTQMVAALKGIDSIDKKLDDQVATYVTKGEFSEFKKRWALSHAIVGIVSSAATALIFYYITGAHKG